MERKAKSDAKTLPDVVELLADVSECDTVFADMYVGRARELFGSVLPPAQYSALKRIQQDIDQAVKESKAATMHQDWRQVETLAAQVDSLRQSAEANAALAPLGERIYERVGVSIDPFSPGLESGPGREHDLAELRDTLVGQLKELAGCDAALASFYESRRAFFAGFGLLSKRDTTKTKASAGIGTAELQQLAAQAAHQGDMTQLRGYAQQLLARQAEEKAADTATTDRPDTAAAVDRSTYGCPVELAVPFAADVVERARALGLVAARSEPLPHSAPLYDYVITNVWQADLAGAQSEHEGAMRTAAVVDAAGFPKDASEPVKVLVGQFLRNPFVNSGGARYLPQFNAEDVLIEDFAEGQDAPASGELLSALGLRQRRGLARFEIEDALLDHGATIVRERLGLDPLEYRLVCIPHDLYMRFGRDRGWGQQQQWTHFDGYQVLKNGTLRALVGGSARYGGLSDLVSIALTDKRDSVVARFVIVRRARQVARWH